MAREIAAGIVVDPEVRFGRPVIKGSRVTVDLVLAKLDGGMTPEEVAQEYHITPDEVRGCVEFRAQRLGRQS